MTTTWQTFQLVEASIDIIHPMIFRNGNQQALLNVELRAVKDNKDYTPTPAELATIRVIDYSDYKQQLPHDSDASSDGPVGWASQSARNEYIHDDDRDGSAPVRRKPRAGETFHSIWVTADADAGSVLNVAISIKLGNATFYTNGLCVVDKTNESDEDEVHTLLGIDSGTRSVKTRPPVRYPSTAVHLSQSIASSTNFVRVVEITLVPMGVALATRKITCTPESLFHWQDAIPGDRFCMYTGYADAGKKEIQWGEIIDKDLPKPDSNLSDETACLVVVGRNNLDFNDHTDVPRGTMDVTLVDAYGSDQSYKVSFVPGRGKYGELQIL